MMQQEHPARLTMRLASRAISRYPRRYLEIFNVARKHQLHYVLADIGLNDPTESVDGRSLLEAQEQHAHHLTFALEELGPCFIKLGQLMSTRPELLPPSYIRALSRLQDHITPVPVEQIIEIIQCELGTPVSQLFNSFDREPLATASIAQVHRAVMHDGTEVAVKVQRPGVRERVEQDLTVLAELARFASQHPALARRGNWEQLAHELDGSLRDDLDFAIEAQNTYAISRQLDEFPRLTTPKVYPDHSSRRVLTLEFIHGKRLTSLSADEIKALDGHSIAAELLSAYLKQIVVEGVFHGDPHPGNVMVTHDGRLALLDFGDVGRFDEEEKNTIIQLLLAFSERQGERVADIYLNTIEPPPNFDRRTFAADVGNFVSRYNDMRGSMGMGTSLMRMLRIAESYRLPIPGVWAQLGKALLNLDGIIKLLAPQLDGVQLVRDYMMQVMEKRTKAEMSPGKMFEWGMDLWGLVREAPRRADTLLSKLANDRLTVQLHMSELEATRQELRRSVNTLASSLLVSSLVIGGGFVLGSILRTREPSKKR